MAKLKAVADVFFPVTALEISEFDLKIRTGRPIPKNEIKFIYGDIFQWTVNQRVIARCTKCEEDESGEGAFLARFSYVGVQPGITKEIRVWLKKEYIAQKQRGG